MRQRDFKVTFLSDIVLHGSSNSEGNIETLDFITGSSFLGMVAKNYDEFAKTFDTFDIFHSSKIRFGEATPLFKNKPTYKAPFCFFAPKLNENNSEVYNNHFVEYSNEDILNKQLKQLRSGYITSNLDYLSLDYVYSQKAAYDKTNRKSKNKFLTKKNGILKKEFHFKSMVKSKD